MRPEGQNWSQRHRMRRRAITPTQDHELIRQPHQSRTVRIHAGEQVKHRVGITYALRQKLPFLFSSSACVVMVRLLPKTVVEAASPPHQYLGARSGRSRRRVGTRKQRPHRPWETDEVPSRRYLVAAELLPGTVVKKH